MRRNSCALLHGRGGSGPYRLILLLQPGDRGLQLRHPPTAREERGRGWGEGGWIENHSVRDRAEYYRIHLNCDLSSSKASRSPALALAMGMAEVSVSPSPDVRIGDGGAMDTAERLDHLIK